MYSDNEHIDDSKLKGLGSTGGFTTPPGYFKQLQSHILTQTTGGSSSNPEVPEGYFDQARLAIIQKTTQRPQLVVWYRKPLVKYAAASLVLISLSFVVWFNQLPANHHMAKVNISDEEILHYFERSDLKDIPITAISFTSSTTTLSDEETYIINQADEQLILEEL
jgi:hypothetical protein